MIPSFDDTGDLPVIADHRQFEVTQEQLRRSELALAELRRSTTVAEFRGQASSVIEHIRRLRDETDVYLGISEADTPPSAHSS